MSEHNCRCYHCGEPDTEVLFSEGDGSIAIKLLRDRKSQCGNNYQLFDIRVTDGNGVGMNQTVASYDLINIAKKLMRLAEQYE